MRDSHSTQRDQPAQRKRSAGVVVVLAGVLLLPACTTDTMPTSPPKSASSSTETGINPETSPPSTAAPETAAAYQAATASGPAQNVPVPTLPAKAKEFSKDGLLAFAEYWYSTLGYIYETGDPRPMMAITDPECKTCSFVGEPVSSWYEDGGWIVGGKMTVHSAQTSFAATPTDTYQVILMVQQSQVSSFSKDAKLNSEREPSVAQADIFIAIYADDSWIAQTAEPLKKG